MKMNKKKIVKWVNMIAFGALLLGGMNFLLMGLFNFDLFAAIFGGSSAVATRVFYSLFGIGAVTLLVSILCKAFMGKKEAPKPATKTATKTSTAN